MKPNTKNQAILLFLVAVFFQLLPYTTVAQTSFGPQQIITPEISNPVAIFSADLNGDGFVDILSASDDDDKIAWFENDGLGDFSEPINISTSADGASAVHAVDLDGDGDMDVISASANDNKIAWYRNNGGGSFSSEIILSISANGASTVDAGDLDNDGDIDIVAGAALANEVVWFQNDGLGNFSGALMILEDAAGVRDVHIADYDGDGLLDIFAALYNVARLVWVPNQGSGNFGDSQIVIEYLEEVRKVQTADIDNDGDIDVFALCSEIAEIVFYKNDGSGEYDLIDSYFYDFSINDVYSFTLADIDNDGYTDVVASCFMDSVYDNWPVLVFFRNNTFGDYALSKIISQDKAYDILCTDVNNDNNLDVIMANYKEEKIACYVNAGDSDFDRKNIIATDPGFVKDIFNADLNNDGNIDLLAAFVFDDKVVWYENDGTGTYGTEHIIVAELDGARKVKAGDLDGDGDMDVVVAAMNAHDIWWFENDGLGNFTNTTLVDDFAFGTNDVVLADFEQDGDLDIIAALANTGEIVWYENDGTANFSDASIISSTAFGLTGIAVADITENGLMDIAASLSSTNRIMCYKQSTTGVFEEEVVSNNTEDVQDVDIADFDNDGDLDIVGAFDNQVYWYVNNGTSFWEDELVILYAFGVSEIHAVDQDADGDIDVCVASANVNTISIAKNAYDGMFFSDIIVDFNAFGAAAVGVADVNNDGILDIMSASSNDGEIAWYDNIWGASNNGNLIASTGTLRASDVYVADLDNDGDEDVIAAASYDDQISWFPNDGFGNFNEQLIIANTTNSVYQVYTFDLDNDGDLDVISASFHGTSEFQWHENLGGGVFGESQLLVINMDYNQLVGFDIYASDLNGDGFKDIIGLYRSEVVWYQNNGDGSFGTEQIIHDCSYATSVMCSDMDNDGDNDIVIGDNNIFWLENNGAGVFTDSLFISDNVGTQIYVCDVNADGILDVVSASEASNKVAWYQNEGAGIFGEEQIIGYTANARSIHANDLDRDGDTDIIMCSWEVEATSRVAWFENEGNEDFASASLISNNIEGGRSVYTGDLNGDGVLDVLSASSYDNKIAWYENLLALNAFITENNPPCVGANTGSLQVELSGATLAPYNYTWQNDSGESGTGTVEDEHFVINSLAAGSYDVTVTNAENHTVVVNDVSLTAQPGNVFEFFNITTTNSTNLLPNGSIHIVLNGGVPSFNYSYTGPTSGAFTSTEMEHTLTELIPGTYTFTITDANNNTILQDITILDETIPLETCVGPLDIVILNDVSGSVDTTEYQESKQFFVDLCNAINVGTGPDESRIAIIEWSYIDSQEVRIPMTGIITELQDYTNLERTFVGDTNPNAALSYGYNYLEAEARPDVPKILVLSTDAQEDQISESLIALAETYKAAGYIIVSIAFDEAYNSSYTQGILQEVATYDVLAPGAPAYSLLTQSLAEYIVNLYVCPSSGESNTVFFNRDGEINITNIIIEDNCVNSEYMEIEFTITAQQQLSLPAGTPITFYYNNPAMASATPIITTYLPCALAAGDTDTLTVTLPFTQAANIWAVLNDDASQSPPINFPITNIEELIYINNTADTTICTEPIPTVSITKYALTPQPICDTLVIYTVDACNIGSVDAFEVQIDDQAPYGFELLNTSINLNDCATGTTQFDLPVGCCVSITYVYDAANAQAGVYSNQGVLLSGPDDQQYLPFNGAATSAEDVVIGEGIDCESDVVLFNKSVSTTQICDASFLTFTFTIENQTNIALQNLSFNDTLPMPAVWAAEPYFLNGLSIGPTSITNANIANFTIAEIPPNTSATFQMDAYLGDWEYADNYVNTAVLGQIPDFVNGNGEDLSASSESVIIYGMPTISMWSDTLVCSGELVQLSAEINYGTNILWTTTGDGFIDNPNANNTTYTVGTTDVLNGQVDFILYTETSLAGCDENQDTLSVKIINSPQAPAVVLDSIFVCEDSPNTRPFLLDIPEGYEIAWFTSSEENTPIAYGEDWVFEQVGTYYASAFNVQNADTCFSSFSIPMAIVVNQLSAEAPEDIAIIEGEQTPLAINFQTNPSNVPYTVFWDNESSLSNAYIEYPIASPSTSTTYTATYTALFQEENECQTSASITVHVTNVFNFVIPTAFSPNNDGINDVFAPFKSPHIQSVRLQVFNRWGQKVYDDSSENPQWDGTYKNKKQELGVYAYSYEYMHPELGRQRISGNVTLLY